MDAQWIHTLTIIDIHHALGMSFVYHPRVEHSHPPCGFILIATCVRPKQIGVWFAVGGCDPSDPNHVFLIVSRRHVPSFRASIPVAVSPSSGDSNAIVYSFLGTWNQLEHVGTTMNQPFLQKVSTLDSWCSGCPCFDLLCAPPARGGGHSACCAMW